MFTAGCNDRDWPPLVRENKTKTECVSSAFRPRAVDEQRFTGGKNMAGQILGAGLSWWSQFSMVDRNICGLPLPPSRAFNFEMDPRYVEICILSGNQLCGEKHSAGLCYKIVLKFSVLLKSVHWFNRVPVLKKSILCLYVAVRKFSKFAMLPCLNASFPVPLRVHHLRG